MYQLLISFTTFAGPNCCQPVWPWCYFLPQTIMIMSMSRMILQYPYQYLHWTRKWKLKEEIAIATAACAVPFWIGSVGSIVGCFLSAFLLTRFRSMKPFEAAIAAGKTVD